jgi:hypothetical protein
LRESILNSIGEVIGFWMTLMTRSLFIGQILVFAKAYLIFNFAKASVKACLNIDQNHCFETLTRPEPFAIRATTCFENA